MMDFSHTNECLYIGRVDFAARRESLALNYCTTAVGAEGTEIGAEIVRSTDVLNSTIPKIVKESGHCMLKLGRSQRQQVLELALASAFPGAYEVVVQSTKNAHPREHHDQTG